MTMTAAKSTCEDDDDVSCCIDGVEGCNLKAQLDDQSSRCWLDEASKNWCFAENDDFMILFLFNVTDLKIEIKISRPLMSAFLTK